MKKTVKKQTVRWFVKVIETETGAIAHEVDCASERNAERTERGILINMDHKKFHTNISSRLKK